MMSNLGIDAILLTKPDNWLHHQRQIAENDLTELAESLRAIILAQRIKAYLKDRNLTAEAIEVDDKVALAIMNVPDMINAIRQPSTLKNYADLLDKLQTLSDDGYDIEQSIEVADKKLLV